MESRRGPLSKRLNQAWGRALISVGRAAALHRQGTLYLGVSWNVIIVIGG